MSLQALITFKHVYPFGVYLMRSTLCLFEEFLALLNSIFYSTDIEESLLWQVVHLAIKYHVEALDSVFN